MTYVLSFAGTYNITTRSAYAIDAQNPCLNACLNALLRYRNSAAVIDIILRPRRKR